jgi:carbamoyl-phosphate synthase large subunit
MQGRIFVSIAAGRKERMIEPVRKLLQMGYRIVSTSGTAKVFQEAGITVEVVKKLHEGRPNLLDQMANGEIQMILNTPSGKGARTDEGRIRAASVTYGVPCVTTLPGCLAVVQSLEALRVHPNPRVKAIQDWIA